MRRLSAPRGHRVLDNQKPRDKVKRKMSQIRNRMVLYRLRLRAMLLGAGSVLDIMGSGPLIQPPMRRRAPSTAASLRSDVEKIGRDFGRVIEREREQQSG